MKFKIFLTSLLTCCFISMTSFAQTELTGKWTVQLDKGPDDGNFKGKEIGIIEFKKARNGTFYFVGVQTKNNYVTDCKVCPTKFNGKRTDDKTTRWGENFKYDARSRMFIDGTVIEPTTGEARATKIEVIDKRTMRMFGVYSKGAMKGKERNIMLTKVGR